MFVGLSPVGDPLARLHCTTYHMRDAVDIHRIFRSFDADLRWRRTGETPRNQARSAAEVRARGRVLGGLVIVMRIPRRADK